VVSIPSRSMTRACHNCGSSRLEFAVLPLFKNYSRQRVFCSVKCIVMFYVRPRRKRGYLAKENTGGKADWEDD
jgi:hypothetical protein